MIENHSFLTCRQYIIELLLKGLHRLEYRGYDRSLSFMNDHDGGGGDDLVTMMDGDDDDI